MTFRKVNVIDQKFDTWLRNWNYISYWCAQPFNDAHFRELFSNIVKI